MEKPSITLHLRTRQSRFLGEVARQKQVSLSKAFSEVLAGYAEPESASRRDYKHRTHLVVEPANLAMLDRLALSWGLNRSDVARRIIDEVCDSAAQMAQPAEAAA